ncbi:MAG: hypothetical protein M3Q65_21865 [Chloroflexota bacterium]|nr:hypothetical protein [Chloroflexota bacterium]
MIGSLNGRVRRLETREDTGAPHACAIYFPEGSGREPVAELYATGARLSLAEYARRWPRHPTLKVYFGDPDGWCIMGEV